MAGFLLSNITSFRGGLNYVADTTQMGPGEYPLAINCRTRFDTVDPINKHLDITDPLFTGTKQACISVGNYLVVFSGGYGWYKNIAIVGSGWAPIIRQDGGGQLRMSSIVDRIYLQDIPASTVNYKRVPASANASADVNLTTAAVPSPTGILVQDGNSQPWIVFADGTARVTKTYEQWTTEDREYVPIGTLMCMYDGILYVVNGNKILRSCTGRPLDFMVVLDVNGNKIAPESGDAYAVSHEIDGDPITAIGVVNSNVKAIVVCSYRNTNLVIPDLTTTLFGEPTFTNQFICSTGAINQLCTTDILGDTAFVTFKGLRSFNAVLQDRNEGRNLPFSRSVFRLFKDIVQTTAAATNFDDYAIFDVNTVYGRAWLIYDTLSQKFAAFDISSLLNGAAVKQFAVAKTAISDRLFFITNDKLFEAFGDTASAPETAQYYCGDTTSNDPRKELKLRQIKCIFTNIFESGTINAIVYGDGKTNGEVLTKNVIQPTVNTTLPQAVPFDYGDDVDIVRNVIFPIDNPRVVWMVGTLISWNFRASLSNISLQATVQAFSNALETAVEDNALNTNYPLITAMTPLTGIASTIVNILGSNMEFITRVETTNGIECFITGQNAAGLSCVIPVEAETGKLKLFTSDTDFIETPDTFTVTTP